MIPVMDSIQSLVDELKLRASTLQQGQQYWLGIAGAPGSGKSTLAAKLIGGLGDIAVVVPMDGYHLYRHQLDLLDNPVKAHARRGAPFTFDVQRFVHDLQLARSTGNGSFPSFDHGIGDPVEDSIQLDRSKHRIVIVEGNYLLLDELPWCQLKETVFHETWFLDVPVEECKRRVLRRHITTGKSEVVAQQRVDNNDESNANLVNAISPKNADRTIRLN